jgi:2-dehydro-3-deoxyphosphogluconate aldolase / (4S)-4-hydroxy-2-oxoglutarate aldolase
MQANEIFARIGAIRVVPVIAINSTKCALQLADALLEGGLPIAEITFRTAAAAKVIEKIALERPAMLVGAGTVLTTDNLHRAAECGASFGVAPGFNQIVAREALKLGFPFAPGVMTPSEIEAALSLGIKVLKFFPAGAVGGINMLRSISAPYLHTGVKFLPTGGLKQNNLKEYLEQKMVLAVGGTWIATQEDIAAQRWDVIRKNARIASTAIDRFNKPASAAHAIGVS